MDRRALEQAIGSLGGEYQLVRELGRGATSIVYLLQDHALQRTVAMKVIRTGIGSDEEAVARLEREAQLVAQLQHPNIVKLYGSHRLPDGAFVLLMEHVPGRNLKEIIQSGGPLPIPLVLEILKDVASALAYAHRRRIVHRDVKPENIYIDEEVGAARLADFGVARPWDQDSRLTVPGASLGTPAYMSPEQIDGREVDGRSDVYSLGLVGYEMILGRHPWEGENVFTTIFKQKSETLSLDLPALSIYPSLSELLERALRKDPDERWATAGELLKALRHVTPSRRKNDPGPWIPELEPAAGGRDRRAEKHEIDWSGLTAPEDEGVGLSLTLAPDADVAPVLVEEPVAEEPDDMAPPPLPGIPRRRRNRLPLWGVAILAVLAASWGGYHWLAMMGEPSAPAPPENGPVPPAAAREPSGGASLSPVGTGRVEGRVGGEVVVTVLATGPGGGGLSDALIGLRVAEGEARLVMDTVRTGAAGFGEARLLLPPVPGTGMVEAVLPGSEDAPVRIPFTVLPGPPHSATVYAGDGQSAEPGEVLAELVAVRVLDELGNPVPGARVGFRPEAGGQARPAETLTDDVGRAFARWVLGSRVGPQAMEVLVPGTADSLVVAGATAVARVAPPPAPTPRERTEAPPPEVRAVGIGVGGSHLCLLRNGSPWCAGSNDRGQDGGRSLEGLRFLAAGGSHSCGLDPQGAAWCWGANESGQVGDGTTQDRSTGARVVTDTRFEALAAGLSHTCGLDGAGSIHCWGRNLYGQLGDGTRSDRGVPGPASAQGGFRGLSAGWNHTCALDGSGRAVCWGGNAEGQLGDGTRVDRLTPAPVPGRFQALAAGAGHTCGISADQVLCWGDNGFGQLGDGTTEDRPSPVAVEGLPARPIALTAGAVHTCVLLEGGSAYCWGQNLHGQLGDGTTENWSRPVRVAGEIPFLSLHAGGGMACGISEDGTTYCWGLNQAGQLGDGTRTNRSIPVRVRGG